MSRVPIFENTAPNAIQLTVCSRQIFAFSRDGGLPFSRIVRRVNSRTRTPIYAVWFSALMSALLGLLSFAGNSAISAVFALVVAGQYVAYGIPISARFLGDNEFKPGPFSLGRAVSRDGPHRPRCLLMDS